MYDAYVICDDILKYINDNKHSMRSNVEYAFRGYNVIPTLIQLADEDLIIYQSGYCSIKPKGQHIIEQYGSYSNYKNANSIPFDIRDFKADLQEVLLENSEIEIDIGPLIDKFCVRRSKTEINNIKSEVGAEVERLKIMGHIEISEEYLFNLKNSALSINPERVILKITNKFREYHRRQPKKAQAAFANSKKRPPIPYKAKTLLQKQINSICPFCSSHDVDHFQVHHIDENPENNELLNLIMLCPTCHSKITKGDISDKVVMAKKQELSNL